METIKTNQTKMFNQHKSYKSLVELIFFRSPNVTQLIFATH